MGLSSDLQAYVMKFKKVSQVEAQAYLDEFIPDWRDKTPASASGVIYHDGDDGETISSSTKKRPKNLCRLGLLK